MRRKDRLIHIFKDSVARYQRPDNTHYYCDGNVECDDLQKLRNWIKTGTMEGTHQEGFKIIVD